VKGYGSLKSFLSMAAQDKDKRVRLFVFLKKSLLLFRDNNNNKIALVAAQHLIFSTY